VKAAALVTRMSRPWPEREAPARGRGFVSHRYADAQDAVRRRARPSPARPRPSSASEPGSGTWADTGLTLVGLKTALLIQPVSIRSAPAPLVFGKLTSLTAKRNDPLPSELLKLIVWPGPKSNRTLLALFLLIVPATLATIAQQHSLGRCGRLSKFLTARDRDSSASALPPMLPRVAAAFVA
jgi:hypothetical protein